MKCRTVSPALPASAQPSAPHRSDALYGPNGMALQQRQGGHESKVHERSAYTYLATRGKPLALALSLLVGGALLAVWKASATTADSKH